MAVLERSELEASPLADLHAIADQVGLDGFRRLRKDDLIDAILGDGGPGQGDAGQEPAEAAGEPPAATAEDPGQRDSPRSLIGRGRRRAGGCSSRRRSRRCHPGGGGRWRGRDPGLCRERRARVCRLRAYIASQVDRGDGRGAERRQTAVHAVAWHVYDWRLPSQDWPILRTWLKNCQMPVSKRPHSRETASSGSRTMRSICVRNASGGHVIGSMARLRRRRSGARVSPEKTCR